MTLLIILLAGLGAVLGWTSFRFRRRALALESALAAVGPVLARQQNPEVMCALCGSGDWRTVLSGGQNQPGIHADETRCPGREMPRRVPPRLHPQVARLDHRL
jgi:hypothetical protein